MGKKRKAAEVIDVDEEPYAKTRVRNRASPYYLVLLVEDLSDDQKLGVKNMDLGTMLDIKCSTLHNPLILWFAKLYDKNSREFVVPGRGRIPLNEASVRRTLGLPLGSVPVPYGVDLDIEAALAPLIFPDDGKTPTRSRVFQILKEMEDYEDPFKQTYVMYLVSTVLSPTTSIHVSNSCYPIMANIANVKNMQWCQFVADQLHKELSNEVYTQACLFHLQLLYVDSLDVSGMADLVLLEGEFAVNRWSKENIDKVALADKIDKNSYGKLELKPEFGINLRLFGGADGFSKWIDTCVDPSCSNEQKARVSNLMGNFASGMVGLMTSLVQGWTALDDNAGAEMERQFGNFSEGITRGGSNLTRPAARVSRGGTRGKNGASTSVPDVGTSSNVPLGKDPVGGSGRSTSEDLPPADTPYCERSEEDPDKYICRSRKRTAGRRHGSYYDPDPEPVLSLTAPGVNDELGTDPLQRSPVLEQRSPVADQMPSSGGAPLEDQARDTGGNVDESLAPEKNDVSQGSAVPDASGPSKPPVICVYKTAGRGKRKFQNLGKETPVRSSPCIAKLRTPVIDSLPESSPPRVQRSDDDDETHEDGNETVENTPPLSPADARELSPPARELGGSDSAPVRNISDMPSSGTVAVTAAAVSVAPLDTVNIAQPGSSSVAITSSPLTAIATDSVVTSHAKADENVVPGQWTDSDGNVILPASVLSKNTAAPSSPVVASEAEPSEDAENVASSVEGSSQADEQTSPGLFFPASSQFNNLQNMDPPVWNFSSRPPVSDAAVVPSPSVSAAASVGPTDQPESPPVVVTKVEKAKFVGADAKMSLPAGIPLQLRADMVRLKTTTADPAPSAPLVPSDPSSAAPAVPGPPSVPGPSVAAPGAAPFVPGPPVSAADPGDYRSQ